jgi:hypothetical protein
VASDLIDNTVMQTAERKKPSINWTRAAHEPSQFDFSDSLRSPSFFGTASARTSDSDASIRHLPSHTIRIRKHISRRIMMLRSVLRILRTPFPCCENFSMLRTPFLILRTLFPCCEHLLPCCEHFFHVTPLPTSLA